jgi:hypothetical protein
VRISGTPPVVAPRDGDHYTLALPPQVGPAPLRLAVGDARQTVTLVPTFRPEITTLSATVRLPDYLGIATPVVKGLRGGGLAVVKGSRVAVTATANRDLETATIDGRGVTPEASTIAVPECVVETPVDVTLAWKDRLGLSGVKPLTVSLVARDDDPPSITVDGLGGKGVLLDSETIRFTLEARDDFGVKQVGLEWVGSGEGVLSTGGAEADALSAVRRFRRPRSASPRRPSRCGRSSRTTCRGGNGSDRHRPRSSS